jgi:hypothetical protein
MLLYCENARLETRESGWGEGMPAAPVFQKDVFISYAREDSGFARRLRQQLEARGVSVWQDVTEIPKGDRFWEKIEDGLQASKTVVAVLSRSSLSSDWLKEELAIRRLQVIEDKTFRLIPVVIGELQDGEIPLRLRVLNGIDFRGLDLEDPTAWKRQSEELADEVQGAFPGTGDILAIPFLVVAMTATELRDLWDDGLAGMPAAATSGDSERLRQLRALWPQQGVGDLGSFYGYWREDWKPASCGRVPLRSVVVEVVARFNQSRAEAGEMLVHPQFFSNEFFDPADDWRLRTWSYLRTVGCVAIVDAISLFHPILRDRFIQSTLGGSEQVSIMIIPPFGASSLPFHQMLEKEIRVLTQVPFSRFEDLDPQCEFGASDLRALRRSLLSMLPQAAQIVQARRSIPQRRASVQRAVPGVQKTQIQNAWMPK